MMSSTKNLSYKLDEAEKKDTKNEIRLIGYFTNFDENQIGLDNAAYQATEDDERETLEARNVNLKNGLKNGVNDGGSIRVDVVVEEPDNMIFDHIHKCCNTKVLYKRIPSLGFGANYTFDTAISDLLAGITVGLTMIPQAIAYASVAGLPSKFGLYSSFVGCFVYAILGSCKDSSIGPTAIMAIITRENLHGMGPSMAILLCFITGIVQLIMGVLQLGFLIDFISGPVSMGFTSAAAIIIATSQVKDLLGLQLKSSDFISVWEEVMGRLGDISPGDATLGFFCMVILLILRKAKDIKIGPEDTKEKSPLQKLLVSFLWLISTGRNILIVVCCGLIAYMFEHLHHPPLFKLSGTVEPGLPEIQLPPFSMNVDNETFSFLDLTSKLGTGVIIVPLLSLLENISLAKVFSDGKTIDATQELIALGTCNFVSSFFGSVPLSGALSRGAVNNASGAKTTFGSIYAGIIVIISLQYLTPYFVYIPKASLAAVIIAAVVFMVEFEVLKPIWKTKKVDIVPAAATFISCLLLRLELGILIGVGINVLFLLYASARPTVHVEKLKSEWGYEYLMITPDRSVTFPSVEYVRSVISKAGVKQGLSSIPVVIDSRHVQGADFTAAKGIKSLIEDFVKRKQPLLFYNLKPSVVEVFQGVRPSVFHHCQTEQQLHDMLKEYYFKSSNNYAAK